MCSIQNLMTDKISLSVDPDDLEREWERQADLSTEWAVRAADSHRKFQHLEARYKLLIAQKSKEIRAQYADKKTTEKLIENEVVCCPDVVQLRQEMIEAEYLADLSKQMVFSVANRKSVLINLTEFNMRRYYADPKNQQQLEPPEADTDEGHIDRSSIVSRNRNRTRKRRR